MQKAAQWAVSGAQDRQNSVPADARLLDVCLKRVQIHLYTGDNDDDEPIVVNQLLSKNDGFYKP